MSAVAYPTKILFWKRITAIPSHRYARHMLLLILQRYYFESESQRNAILLPLFNAVAYPTKILFWKRITAERLRKYNGGRLLLILQRYYFESESQLGCRRPLVLFRCCLSYKDTILKANHSSSHCLEVLFWAVAYPTKILFWKRITA